MALLCNLWGILLRGSLRQVQTGLRSDHLASGFRPNQERHWAPVSKVSHQMDPVMQTPVPQSTETTLGDSLSFLSQTASVWELWGLSHQ
ncbi:hypothetical protein DPEC_G00012750 [Dallia pectoralis]|uniref:Uncharacterized protein n=1 Tax=Dallia pectoralis TaxID=75939 RepID=A0ACC2HMQ2_DALPE|nr:hypothetical protein DPEC_G00012750 [Dallia pectoralis]